MDPVSEGSRCRQTAQGWPWRWCQRRPLVASLAGLLTASVVVGVIAVSVQWRRAEANAVTAGEAAERADSEAHNATVRLYESLVRDARSTRDARRVGFRDRAWERLGEALELGIPEVDRLELRNEAVSCLVRCHHQRPNSFVTIVECTSDDPVLLVEDDDGGWTCGVLRGAGRLRRPL